MRRNHHWNVSLPLWRLTMLIDWYSCWQVYCDMSAGGGWMRVVDIDPAKTKSCFGSHHYITTPKPLCTRPRTTAGCISAYFSTHGIPYREVRGFAYGYQVRNGKVWGPEFTKVLRKITFRLLEVVPALCSIQRGKIMIMSKWRIIHWNSNTCFQESGAFYL